ncbi:MAG: GMC family oxidoreductase [Balneolaceae bacterium]|nr:GMC family oxidoreductase [Balneolaceae bacterium]
MLAIHEIVQSLRENKIDKSMLSKLKAILSNPNPVLNSAFKKVTGIDWISKYGRKNKYHGYLLNIMSEQVPNPESRITLGRDKDCFGQNKIELNWKLNSLDIDSIKRFQDVLNRELRNNRLGYLDIDLKNDLMSKKIHGGYHHMGTTRMDTDPKGGVVDENCRVHGIDNLFVSGSSVFPTVGYANPTLTIVAMAIRLADYVKQNNLSSTYNKRVGLNNQ